VILFVKRSRVGRRAECGLRGKEEKQE
jgi:hypothetical protein